MEENRKERLILRGPKEYKLESETKLELSTSGFG